VFFAVLLIDSVYDTVSIRPTIYTTLINICEYMLDCVMHKLFLNKMLQKL